MKISKIEIKQFHQFKDIDIDLTYPAGHPKEGEPLSKVCFIGQSGTGKTSLLELIPKFVSHYNTQFVLKSGIESICDQVTFYINFGLQNEYSASLNLRAKEENGEFKYSRSWGNQKHNGKETDHHLMLDFFKGKWTKEIASKPIYFPAYLNYDIEIVPETAKIYDRSIIDFSKDKVSTVWSVVLEKIQSYQELELQIRQEISKIVEETSINIEKITQAVKRLEDWKNNEFNPVQDIADNCLDRLLATFKLKVKTELDIKSKDDIGFIKIVDFSGNEIPNGLWSTGTKQIVLSAMPLYLLKPKHTIILFDEPERSLYPDLQRLIIDFYSSLTEDCQFFYCTHSPIIASNFEPWEIVELKFNVHGNVYRELYYEGENHVDNYKINPQHMRWDDILQRVFDMENDGSLIRKKKLDELATNNVKYRKLERAGKLETEEAKAILKTIQKLSSELSKWN